METKNFSELISSILSKLGFEGIFEEKEKEEFLILLEEIIQKIITLRIINELSEEDAGEFLEFIEKNKDLPDAPIKIYEFLKGKIHNIDEIIAEEIENFILNTQNFTSSLK